MNYDDYEDIGEYEIDSFVVSDGESVERWSSTDSDEESIEIVLDDEGDDEDDDERDETLNVDEIEQLLDYHFNVETNDYVMSNPENAEQINTEPNSPTFAFASEPVASTSNTMPFTQVAPDLNASQSDDGCTCPICFEHWANSDAHRLVSLKCGHLFGKSCVEKWLREQQTSKRRCPQCNTAAKLSDVRHIYAKRLKVIDTREREELQQKYETSEQLRVQAQQQLQELEFKLVTTISENERLKEELMNAKRPTTNRINNIAAQNKSFQLQRKTEPFKFVLETEINSAGECRVLATCDVFGYVVVSQQSINPLFKGYGLRRLSVDDFKPRDYIHLHQNRIRDVVFHPYDSLVLTVAEDKTVKVTSLVTNAQVANIDLECNGWSLCWNQTRTDSFYVGLQNGNILQYDLRNTSSVVNRVDSTRQPPIVSLQYLECNNVEGIIATHLSHCNFHSLVNSKYEAHRIPIKGSFTSSHIDKRTGNILLSMRPTKVDPQTTHSVLSISSIGNTMKPKIVRQFKAGSKAVILSRSKIFPNPSDAESSLICAGDEDSKGTLIWDLKCGIIQTLKSSSHILDHSVVNVSDTTMLTTLTEKSLSVYKWNY